MKWNRGDLLLEGLDEKYASKQNTNAALDARHLDSIEDSQWYQHL